MEEMKVLYITHLLANNLVGGAQIQIKKTKFYFNKLNCDVRLFNSWEDKIDNYDIIHLFNPNQFPLESLKILEVCKNKIRNV